MTFLIDPLLLVFFSLISYWIGEIVKNKTGRPVGSILSVFSLSIITFTSTSLYLNMQYMDWLWMPFYPIVSSGKDLMINSGIFEFESVNTAGLIDLLALIQIAVYPLWSFIGIKIWIHLHHDKMEG